MKFIEVTSRHSGNAIYVNVNHIVAFGTDSRSGHTYVDTLNTRGDYDMFSVKESVNDVKNAINDCANRLSDFEGSP